jgi:hypothetical protein
MIALSSSVRTINIGEEVMRQYQAKKQFKHLTTQSERQQIEITKPLSF